MPVPAAGEDCSPRKPLILTERQTLIEIVPRFGGVTVTLPFRLPRSARAQWTGFGPRPSLCRDACVLPCDALSDTAILLDAGVTWWLVVPGAEPLGSSGHVASVGLSLRPE